MRVSSQLLAPYFKPLQRSANTDLETFKRQAFNPKLPYLFPKGTFSNLPVIQKWFLQPGHGSPAQIQRGSLHLNTAFLSPFSTHLVSIEHTSTNLSTNERTFTRAEAPLAFFMAFVEQYFSDPVDTSTRLTIAQSSLSSFHPELKSLFPTPSYVSSSGKGDIYDSSLWLGIAPTVTPLHRDPNPNILVQIAGSKIIRLLEPEAGRNVWDRVGRRIAGGEGGKLSEGGESMMRGSEGVALEEEIWGCGSKNVVKEIAKSDAKRSTEDEGHRHVADGDHGWEARLEVGDGVFIPQGWWHAVHGVGEGLTGSVNWWFR